MTHLSSIQVLNAICASVRSFLGPDQRIKCILEDEDEDTCGSLVSSCSELLHSLDVEHPVGRVAVEASLAHQKSHGTGTTTMVTMAGLWATEIQSLITQGIPIPAIIKYGDECLEHCLASLESIVVPCPQLVELTNTQMFPDAKLQVNRSSKWDSSWEDDSDTVEHRDQFVEVQLSSQHNQSISRPAEFESKANLPEINPYMDSAPGMQDDEDDVSWFFEGTSKEMYSLEQHKSDCEALLQAVDGVKKAKVEKESTFLKENGIRETLEIDSDDEFDSCFLLEDQDATDKPTRHTCGRCAQDDSDDEFESCFPDVENSIRKPSLDSSDDEFDSCFPAEMPTASKRIMMDESSNDIPSDGGDSNSQQTNECDGHASTESLKTEHLTENLEQSQETDVDLPGCSTDASSQYQEFRTKPQSAILESIQNLLKTKHKNVLSKRLGGVKNNSRHFKSFETVLDQHVNEDQNSSCSEVVSEILESKRDSRLNSAIMASKTSSKSETNFQSRSSLASPKLGESPNTETKGTPQQEHTSRIQGTIVDYVKVRSSQAAARRLVSVQNTSRHFQTTKSAAAQSVLEEEDTTSGQRLNLKVTVDALDEHKRISSRDGNQESKFSSSHFEFVSETRNTPTNRKDWKATDEQQIRDLEQLGFGLSHGSDLEMRLVIDAFKMQMEKGGVEDTRVPDLNRLNVCTIAGPPVSASHLQDGLLLPVDHHQRAVISESEGKQLKALLVNGDATPTFKHAGYKNKVKQTTVHTWGDISSTQETSWLKEMVILLQELDVKLLILKGHAHEHLIHHCLSKKILLLQDVPYKSLLALGEACSTPVLTYLADATMEDIACGISVAFWESRWAERTRVKWEGLKERLFARVCVDGKVLQTAMLCHPVASLLPAMKARFWSGANRLQNAVSDRCVLPGAGIPEQSVIRNLLGLNELSPTIGYHGDLSCFKSFIVSAFVEGFLQYLIQVLKNLGKMDNKSLAKALIMNGLQKDKLEPVLSSSSRPEPVMQTDSPDHTLNSTGHNWSEPDQSSHSEFNAPVNKSGDSPSCNHNRSLQDKNIQVKSLCKTDSFSNSRADPASQTELNKLSSKQKTLTSCGNDSVVYDSYTVKKATWDNAWALLKTILRIDAHITTGVQEPDQPGSSFHFGNSVIL